MKRLDLDDIKIKVSEVKALFVLGQKIIPVLEDVFQFVYEIQPLFDEINTSIQETTTKVPKAADKIINISNATEMATSEILDYVDEIFKAIEKLTSHYKEDIQKQKIAYKEIIDQIKQLKEKPETAKQADEMLISLQKLYRHSIGKKTVDLWMQEFEKLNILANKILMALQFQDITSQQLQAANHLISQVQNKLGQLMAKLGNVTPDEIKMLEGADEQTFNEHAEYIHSEDRQKMIDEIEASFAGENEELSQEEIDRLAQEALNNKPDQGEEVGENDEQS